MTGCRKYGSPFLGELMMQLDDRLKAVGLFAQNGKTVADIGTDHAYLAVYLINNGVEKVIAADLNKGPCESAKRTVREYDLTEKIEIRQGNGLSVLKPGEVDTVCIAGMGGKLISVILAADSKITKSISRLVVQPMNDAGDLRDWLYNNGWYIKDEVLAKADGKIYEIICAEQGDGPAPAGVMREIGELIWAKKDPLLEEHILGRLRKKEKVIQGMENSKAAQGTDKYERFLKEKEELEVKLSCLNVR